MTHKIHHLSFGHHLLEADAIPGGKSNAHFLMQELLARGHNPLNLDLVEQPFVMEHPNATWEHFLKVVPEIYRMASISGDHPTYQFVFPHPTKTPDFLEHWPTFEATSHVAIRFFVFV